MIGDLSRRKRTVHRLAKARRSRRRIPVWIPKRAELRREVHTVFMGRIGVGVLAVLLWLVISVPLGMLVGALLRKRAETDGTGQVVTIPRQRSVDVRGGSGDRATDPAPGRLPAPGGAGLRGAVAALSILVGALTFTVGTAAAVSSLPGPTPPAVAGVLEAVSPLRVYHHVRHNTPAEDRAADTTQAAPKRTSAKAPPKRTGATGAGANARISAAPKAAVPAPSAKPTPQALLSPLASPVPSTTGGSIQSPLPTGEPDPLPMELVSGTASPSPAPSVSASPSSSAVPSPAGTSSASPSPLAAPVPTS